MMQYATWLMVGVMLCLVGCQTTTPATLEGLQPTPVERLTTSKWVLRTIGGEKVPEFPSDWPETRKPSLEFSVDGRQVAGATGVNRFFAPVTLSPGKISVGQAGRTKMAGPEDLMALETRYMEVLRQVKGFHIRGSELWLTGETGAVLATFQRIGLPAGK